MDLFNYCFLYFAAECGIVFLINYLKPKQTEQLNSTNQEINNTEEEARHVDSSDPEDPNYY